MYVCQHTSQQADRDTGFPLCFIDGRSEDWKQQPLSIHTFPLSAISAPLHPEYWMGVTCMRCDGKKKKETGKRWIKCQAGRMGETVSRRGSPVSSHFEKQEQKCTHALSFQFQSFHHFHVSVGCSIPFHRLSVPLLIPFSPLFLFSERDAR